MKASLITLLALAAAPVIAEGEVTKVGFEKLDMSKFSGGVAARAVAAVETDEIAQLVASTLR